MKNIRHYADENFAEKYAFCYHCGREQKHDWYRLANNKKRDKDLEENWGVEDQYYFVKLTDEEMKSRVYDIILVDVELHLSVCAGCGIELAWQNDKNLCPPFTLISPPDREVPLDVKADYNEARKIYKYSSRGAATLLRIALEKLLIHLKLGSSSADLSSMVNELSQKKKANLVECPDHIIAGLVRTCVSEKGTYSTKAINEIENPKDVEILFHLINEITEEFIKKKRRIDFFNNHFS